MNLAKGLQEQGFAAIPHTYIPITLAGDGVYGWVFFCVRKAEGDLVAVKVLEDAITSSPQAGAELQTLRCIRNKALENSDLNRIFPQLITSGPLSDEGGESYKWLVTSAINPPVTLFDFQSAATTSEVPRELAAKLFLDLGAALRFLHDTLHIAHNDVHFGNIMLSTSAITVSGANQLPHFILIDFGNAVEIGRDADAPIRDAQLFCERVYQLMKRKRPLPDGLGHLEREEWAEFERIMEIMGENVAYARLVPLGSLWQQFEGCAKRVVDGATKETLDVVTDIVHRPVREGNGFVSDQDIRGALDHAKWDEM